MRKAALALLLAVAAGCRASAPISPAQLPAGQDFPVGAAGLFGVCWPKDAPKDARVRLELSTDDARFETFDGADNATGRCLRELAAAFPFTQRPTQPIDVRPPTQPLDGWAVLGWTRLLAASRFTPSRGLLDPLPAAASCVALGAPRPTLTFTVSREPELLIQPSAPLSQPSEHCLEAVLGAVAWPGSRVLTFTFAAPPPAVGADRAGSLYASGPSDGAALDPAVVRRAFAARREQVQQCWEEVMARRPTAAGVRTVRWAPGTQALQAWVVPEPGGVADVLLDACLVALVQQAPFEVTGPGEFSWSFGPR